MSGALPDMTILCELANQVEADALMEALAAGGVEGAGAEPTGATADRHAGWAVLVPTARMDAAREVLRAFRERPGDRGFLVCPACAYSLDGLPRCDVCPECGFALTDYRTRLSRVLMQAGTEFEAEFAVNLLREGGIPAYAASGSFTTLYGMGSWNVYVRDADVEAARAVLLEAGPMGRKLVEHAVPVKLERKALAGLLAILAVPVVGLVLAAMAASPVAFGVAGAVAIAAMVGGAVVLGLRARRGVGRAGRGKNR